ncbi:MAG TPA: beta-L-arabinofuranosidase domain-containing protein [Actinophytocola sp.]|uniref:glycoside hydrolase family 127 protein n=1 Tax=Actinophytocola sp. TaxID=1872138 RepID=UPI002DBCEC3B|nr:beta-L-arabinofuranosidase domain-containing protein [Actinophytocola sp.]HEU5471596.1 beta-L-arabinofuranosidase domain-containing protein [Actinophytocola sp.]
MARSAISRRTLLAVAGGAVACSALPVGRASAAVALRPDVGVSVFPFPLPQVALLDSPFRANMNRILAYLSFLDPDRMLHTFRVNVGLSSTAQPVGGWDAPNVELRGHSMGHFLSALALAYANTGTAAHKAKGDYLVAELARCQARAGAVGFNTGYLSAYPESFIDRVEARQTVWAPYYTLHKVMAGLLDMHLLTGNAQALDVLVRQAAWVKFRTDRLSAAQIQSMLDTEFGGMNEVLTNLYAVTENPDHLTVARRFDHARIFDPLAANQDRLSGFHANTQIPKIIGAIREYHQTGVERYRTIATNFWDIVTGHHSYAIGGNSNGEYFQPPEQISSQLSDNTCESCNSYNMLKLTRQLFFTNPSRVDYLDFYERALYNHILAGQNPNAARHQHTYYVPMRPGGIKTYSNDYNNFTCCHGTGMESHTKFADSIYFFAGETLYVNLFIPSVLTWPGRGITIRQDTTFPDQPSTRLTVTGSGHIALRVRVPSWARQGTQVRLNGVVQNVTATPNTFLTLDRNWASGDVVDIAVTPSIVLESAPDNAAVRAVKYGAVVLAGEYGTNNLSTMPTLDSATLRPDPNVPLRFTATASTGAVSLIPFFRMHGQRYTVYWRNNAVPPIQPFVAHYPFDETSGTAAGDATGNGRTATLVGAASWAAGAVSLAGTDGHVRLPGAILSGANDFTIASRVRLTTVSTWSRVFDFGTGTSAYLFLTPRSSTGTARFAITTSGSGGEQRIEAPAALPAATWTHVAVTLAGNLAILYVNGTEVARNANMTLRPANLGSTGLNYLGRSQYAGDPFLSGQLDDFRIYSRALSATEIRALI